MGTTGSKESGGLGNIGEGGLSSAEAYAQAAKGFVTVGTAKTPEEEKQESAEVAILRKVSELQISKPLLSWKREELQDLEKHLQSKHARTESEPSFSLSLVSALEESVEGGKVQWTLDTAFSALSKWFSRQASIVTRQQLSLHEEIEEVSYMAKLALTGVNKSKDALKSSAKEVQSLAALSQEMAMLKQSVQKALETQERLSQVLDKIAPDNDKNGE